MRPIHSGAVNAGRGLDSLQLRFIPGVQEKIRRRVSLGLEGRHDGPIFLRLGNKRAWSRVLTPSECRWLTQPDLVAGPGLFIGAANAIGRCDSMRLGGTDVEVRRSQQGPTASSHRTRARLGEGLRIELDWLVSLLHPAGAVTEERARARIQATPARSSVDK